MRIFKDKTFSQWANEIDIDEVSLLNAINEITHGLYEANLGGNVYKKRVPIGHRGKSGGARTIIAFRVHDRAVFIYGFSKNKKDNISKKELEALKSLAKVYLNYNAHEINQAIKAGRLIEVKHEKINS